MVAIKSPARGITGEDLGAEQIIGPNTLLRLLRSPNDPPNSGGPTKIDLATEVWRRATPQLPGKAEILRDWILSTWDQKDTQTAENLITRTSYLDLLNSTLCYSPASLPPRYLSQYFDAVAAYPESGHGHAVWISSTRASEAPSDVWVHAYVRMLRCLARPDVTIDHVLVSLVENKVLAAVSMTQASKKSSISVVASLHEVAPAFSRHDGLRDDILGAVLWPLSSLKLTKGMSSVLSVLPKTIDMLPFLPRLLRSYTTTIKTNQRELFVQPTSSRTSYGIYLQDKTRSSVNSAVGEIKAFLRMVECDEHPQEELRWACRERIWQAVARSGLYLEVEPSWTALLAEDTRAAAIVLQGQPAIGLVRSVMLFLTTAEELDHTTTSVTASSMAWCLAAPADLYSQAEGLLLATLHYHLLSHTTEAWFTIVLDALLALVNDATTSDIAQSIRQLVAGGPLFGDRLRRDMGQMRQKDQIVQMMTVRVRSITELANPVAVILDVISRCCVLLLPISTSTLADILAAFETVLSTSSPSLGAKEAKTSHRDTTYEACLAATIRIGRHWDARTRARLDAVYDLQHVVGSALSEDLRVESFLWLSSRLCDLEDVDKLLALLVSTLGAPKAEMIWRFVDLDTWIVINALASDAQLVKLSHTMLTRHMLSRQLYMAESVELPRIADALSRVMVESISLGKDVDAVFAVVPSLPASLFNSAGRREVMSAAASADATGTSIDKEALRRCLDRFVDGSSTQIDADYWAVLEEDVERDFLRSCSETLLKTAIRSALPSIDDTSRLLSMTKRDSTRMLFAEVAVTFDFARIPGPVGEQLSTLAKRLSSQPTASMSPRMRLSTLKLSRWCQPSANVDHLLLERGTEPSCEPHQLELLRLGCHDAEGERHVLRLLLRPDVPSGDKVVLREEAISLGLQSVDFTVLVKSCLVEVVSSTTRGLDTEAAFDILSALISVRRQGSGKVVLQCRETLLSVLLDRSASSSEPRLRALKALIRYRANVLRVTDAARIIGYLGSSPNGLAIDIAHAIVLARSDLVVHILPTLVRFLCDALCQMQEDTAASLGRLVATITRSRKGTSRDVALSGPFSKHAPMVLVEYVRCLARTTVSPSTRRVLQNSMFKICDAVVRLHDRGREGEGMGMPYGLGEAGEAEKEIWAELWRQWSKSRYKGLG